MTPGCRYDVRLRCDDVRQSDSKEWGTFYVYSFRDFDGNRYTTSTSERRWKPGLIYTGRATCKKYLGRLCVVKRCTLSVEAQRSLI